MSDVVVQPTEYKPIDFPPSMALTPMQMLHTAIERGATIEVVEKLMGLYERWAAMQARRAFDAAIADAKAKIKPIVKNRTVDFTGKTGMRTHYKHEDLAEIARSVDPILAEHGLSYRFRTTSKIGEAVTVTCILSHRDGHSEENTLDAGRDDSGNKNSIQAVGSTVTFLQRYTLKASLGLAAAADDDARAAGAPETISDEQVEVLCKLVVEVGGTRATPLLNGFLKKFNIEAITALPASEFRNAVDALNAKRAQ